VKYYVYHLIDPRDGLPFYVGKGCGNRIEAHERQARLTGEKLTRTAKCNRIRRIWGAGLSVIRQHICYFTLEQDALDFEYKQINSLPGLTNIYRLPSGRTQARARRRLIRSKRRESPAPRQVRTPFTESLIARVAWIVSVSNGLRDEFTTELIGASGLYKAIEGIFNKLGYVKFARQIIEAWAEQNGWDAVRERFLPYGIDLRLSENTENS
jgi:hypothetical protein